MMLKTEKMAIPSTQKKKYLTRIFTDLTDSHGLNPRKSVKSVESVLSI